MWENQNGIEGEQRRSVWIKDASVIRGWEAMCSVTGDLKLSRLEHNNLYMQHENTDVYRTKYKAALDLNLFDKQFTYVWRDLQQ